MKTKVVLCAMLMCVTSAIAVGQQVSVNYNHSQSFSGYHTYTQQDIDSALQGKGLQKVQASQNPDLILVVSGGMRQETSYSAWGMRGIGGGMGGITPQQNVEATLIVDLHDTKTQSLVWRGIGQDTLSNNGNKNQQIVGKAVQKMFNQWPKS